MDPSPKKIFSPIIPPQSARVKQQRIEIETPNVINQQQNEEKPENPHQTPISHTNALNAPNVSSGVTITAVKRARDVTPCDTIRMFLIWFHCFVFFFLFLFLFLFFSLLLFHFFVQCLKFLLQNEKLLALEKQ